MAGRKRNLALFNLAIDSKLRGCDVVAVRVDDVAPSGYAMDRATTAPQKQEDLLDSGASGAGTGDAGTDLPPPRLC
jgi:hypothetical protein